MARLYFSPAVSVEGDEPSSTITISSVERAAEQLLNWQDHGPKCCAAIQVCVDAMIGGATANQARTAFLAAAEESGRLRPAVLSAARPSSFQSEPAHHHRRSGKTSG